MSNVTIESDTPPTVTQPRETKLKKATKGGKPAKTAKNAKAKPATKRIAKPTSERTNKKAEVITMMKRAKGATLAEIVEAKGSQPHTVRADRWSDAPWQSMGRSYIGK